ncbi:hypothetical protein AB0E56_02405 [Microbacterium sp. NPDC028030]|uniref:hypothetical protein n=1 Tax=Microbacterium sp. NPDC028030 TaxID=3155124 RepID=UPI00340D815A
MAATICILVPQSAMAEELPASSAPGEGLATSSIDVPASPGEQEVRFGATLEDSILLGMVGQEPEAPGIQSYPHPQTVPGDKVCFSAPFRIFKDGQVYASFYANTIVSKTNYIVITAYPSDNSQASACLQDD